MSRIADILARGRSFTSEPPILVSLKDFETIEMRLGANLPEAYREFVKLGGLSELNFDVKILSPTEIEESCEFVPDDLVPFGDNGCGDLYVWNKDELPESSVYFWDHETGSVSEHSASFIECAEKWRRD